MLGLKVAKRHSFHPVFTNMTKSNLMILLGALLALHSDCSEALAAPRSRRGVLQNVVSAGAGVVLVGGGSSIANAADVDIDSFLSTGGVSMPMGVSGQAGKSKPVTGVELKDGTEVSRDKKGNVFAEILLSDNSGKKFPTAISFVSPWKLETGAVFDIETRDAASGDSAFLAVSPNVQGKSISELKDSFFVDALFGPYGRFSFYGQPTDVKYKKGVVNDNGYRTIDGTFTKIPRAYIICAEAFDILFLPFHISPHTISLF